jgi:putative IMPACT (imprinted ancient) family translation regulator
VLQGSGVGDIVVVVTRYFGGTKLGTGGLVRAYGDAVRAVLDVLPRAMRVPTVTLGFEVPYSLYERVRLLVETHGGEALSEEFGVQVAVQARFAAARLDAFRAALRDASAGRLEGTVVARDESTILPLGALGADES